MKVLVVGAGPMARRHADNLRALGHESVEVPRIEAVPTRKVAAVVAASPPAAHLDAVDWAVERAVPVLVEKPLAAAAAGVAEALAAAHDAGLHVAVAYNLRFHPALRSIADAVGEGRVGRLLSVRAEVGSYLPWWHQELDYRRSSAARADLGGGALRTLSHELDYVLWIAGPAELAAAATARVSALELDVEDVGELVLRHASGAISSVHCDLLDRAYSRRSRWVGESGTIEWVWGGPVRLYKGDTEQTLWRDDRFDLAVTYVDELRAFLAGEPPPGDALAEALRVTELLEEAHPA